jgi:regulator of Ty1 transposition protein 103
VSCADSSPGIKMALLNQKGFERKLQQMSSAQDSVQTVSLWIIHHKKYAGDIVRVWTDHLKKCRCCNDVLFSHMG